MLLKIKKFTACTQFNVSTGRIFLPGVKKQKLFGIKFLIIGLS